MSKILIDEATAKQVLAVLEGVWKGGFSFPTLDRIRQAITALREALAEQPAQRKWVGLTDAEWMNIVNKDHAWFGQRPEDVAHEVAKLVEAKLKEKNA